MCSGHRRELVLPTNLCIHSRTCMFKLISTLSNGSDKTYHYSSAEDFREYLGRLYMCEWHTFYNVCGNVNGACELVKTWKTKSQYSCRANLLHLRLDFVFGAWRKLYVGQNWQFLCFTGRLVMCARGFVKWRVTWCVVDFLDVVRPSLYTDGRQNLLIQTKK